MLLPQTTYYSNTKYIIVKDRNNIDVEKYLAELCCNIVPSDLYPPIQTLGLKESTLYELIQ